MAEEKLGYRKGASPGIGTARIISDETGVLNPRQAGFVDLCCLISRNQGTVGRY